MNIFLYALICVSGLCWGSFLNVLIVRTIAGENIFFPASKCPECDVPILWHHKIPVISYFYLHGKCPYCNASISPMYPVTECLGLVIFLFAWLRYSSIIDILSVIVILSMFLTLAWIDFKSQRVSKPQAYTVMAAGIIFNSHNILNSVLGAAAGAGLIFLLIILGRKFFDHEIFGKGDIFLLGALGAVTGIDELFIYIPAALIIQVLIILPKYLKGLKKSGREQTLKQLIFYTAAFLLLYLFRNISFWGSKVLILLLFIWMIYAVNMLIRELLKSISANVNLEYCPIAPAIAISCLLFLL